MTPRQIKAGRALLGWQQQDLATAAGVSLVTVKRVEADIRWPRDYILEQLEQAFQRAGIRFSASSVCHRPVNISMR